MKSSPRIGHHLHFDLPALQTWQWVLLVGAVFLLLQLPHCIWGLYVRDEGRELTLSFLTWRDWSSTYTWTTFLSAWITGGWLRLTEHLGVFGGRLGAALAYAGMAAFCFPILRRFMPAWLAVLGLVGSFLAVSFSSARFLGYRNLPPLFLYAALYAMYRQGVGLEEKTGTTSWRWMVLAAIFLAAGAAAKLPYLAGLALPLIPLAVSLFWHNTSGRIPWTSSLLLDGLAGGLTLLYYVPFLIESQSEQAMSSLGAAQDKLDAIIGYMLNLLDIYLVAFQKGIQHAVSLVMLVTIVWASLTLSGHLRTYIMGGLAALAYLVHGFYESILFCVLVAFFGLDLKKRWVRYLGYTLFLALAWRYLGHWMFGWGLLMILGRESGLFRQKWTLVLLGAASIVVGVFFLKIKWWHTHFFICLLLPVIRIAVAKWGGQTLDKEYLCWLGLATTCALTTMIGSSMFLRNNETSLFLLLPLSFWGQTNRCASHWPFLTRFQSVVSLAMISLLLAMVFLGLTEKDQVEQPWHQLTVRIDAPRLRQIYTTPQKAESISKTLAQLGRYVKPQELLLAYNHIPLFYFLTQTTPYCQEPWVELGSLKFIRDSLDSKASQGQFPQAIVRTLADTRKADWGGGARIYNPEGPSLEIRLYLDDWCKQNGFRVVWRNDDFEILTQNTSSD